jgi:hypothetical protein
VSNKERKYAKKGEIVRKCPTSLESVQKAEKVLGSVLKDEKV